jgi:hypothetical protein
MKTRHQAGTHPSRSKEAKRKSVLIDNICAFPVGLDLAAPAQERCKPLLLWMGGTQPLRNQPAQSLYTSQTNPRSHFEPCVVKTVSGRDLQRLTKSLHRLKIYDNHGTGYNKIYNVERPVPSIPTATVPGHQPHHHH